MQRDGAGPLRRREGGEREGGKVSGRSERLTQREREMERERMGTGTAGEGGWRI